MAIWRTLRTDQDGNGKQRRRQTGHSYRWDFDSVRLVLCYGTFGFAYVIPATFVPAMARELVTDPLVFGWAWPVFGIAAALSTLVAAGPRTFDPATGNTATITIPNATTRFLRLTFTGNTGWPAGQVSELEVYAA